MLHAADLAWAQSELEPFAPADADRHDFRVPEVTSCERPLAIARAFGWSYSVMTSAPSYLRALLKPLNLAAYLTWLAILVDLLQASRSDFAGQPQTSIMLMLAFLVAFSARDLLDQNRSSWRHRLLIALQALFAISLCALWRNDSAAPVLTVIVVAQCAMVLSLPALIGAVVMINLGLLYVFAVVRGLNHAWMEWLIYGGFQSFAALTAWYARSARESAEALQLTNAHLLATRCLLEESARDQERLRLARELHDVAGHKLTALKLNLSLLQLDRSVESGAALAVSARLAHELLDDLRAVVTQLRMHDGIDVRHALAQLVEPLPRPQVHLDLADDARVSNVAQAEALIRAAQEAITNIARHSNAQHAWLSLRRDSHAICLHVHDDGCGNPQPHFPDAPLYSLGTSRCSLSFSVSAKAVLGGLHHEYALARA